MESIKKRLRKVRVLSYPYAILDSFREKQETKRKREAIQLDGLRYLSLLTQGLKSEGLVVFADFGTLLGLVREGALLNHDTDIDIGLYLKSESELALLESYMSGLGFRKIYAYYYEGRCVQHSYAMGLVKIDFCFYRSNDSDQMHCYLFYRTKERQYAENEMSVVRKTCAMVKEVEPRQFGGWQVVVPVESNKLLEDKYGENWDIPDSAWSYWEGPNTIKCDRMGTLEIC